jgi:hypothetical protein
LIDDAVGELDRAGQLPSARRSGNHGRATASTRFSPAGRPKSWRRPDPCRTCLGGTRHATRPLGLSLAMIALSPPVKARRGAQ